MQPFFATWTELHLVFMPLHENEKRWVDMLHDIWKQGPPSPDSRILVTSHYDERLDDSVKRLVLPSLLMPWLKDCAKSRGIPLSIKELTKVLNGEYN